GAARMQPLETWLSQRSAAGNPPTTREVEAFSQALNGARLLAGQERLGIDGRPPGAGSPVSGMSPPAPAGGTPPPMPGQSPPGAAPGDQTPLGMLNKGLGGLAAAPGEPEYA